MPDKRPTISIRIATLVIAATALAGRNASSQDEPPEKADAAEWYQVELIVFEQGRNATPTGEDFSPAPSDWVYLGGVYPGDESGVIRGPGPEPSQSESDTTEGRTPLVEPQASEEDSSVDRLEEEVEKRFTQVDESTLTLTAYYEALRRRDAYQPLLYLAWAQPGYASDAAPEIPVDVFGSAGPGLDGNVLMYRSRYLHLQLDLILEPDQPPADTTTPSLLVTESPRFELIEKRRMRSNEIHYFDHPRLGALAVIRPLDEAPVSPRQ